MSAPSYSPTLIYNYKGYEPPAKGWRYNLESMKRLDKEVAALESRKKQILERFNAADLGADEAGKLSSELGKLQDDLDVKEMRWLELAERG